jgi:hypothetical protein
LIQGRNGFWKITPDPVDPGSHVLSIFLKAEIDTGTANRPQVILRANLAVGVQSDIIATAAAGTDWQEIVIAFTSTAKGAFEVWLYKRGPDHVRLWWDSLTLT